MAGALPLGSSVFDSSTVTPTPAVFTPTGSVAYTFFTSVDCTTGGTAAGGGALVAGVPPNSATQGPLAAGSYSFRAVFTSGDGNFTGSTSTCEALTISAGTSTTATVIKNAVGGTTVTGPLPLGSSVFDTATVTPTPGTGFTPTGSVAYTFFTSFDCTTGGTPAGGGALAGGVPPNSNTEGPLAAGSYSFRAVFTSGDSNFGGSTSTCEPLTINAGTSSTATVIKNAVGGTTVAGPLPLGSSVFDSSTVTPTPAAFTPTGSVAYTFFTSVDCTTGGTPAEGGVLVGGVPPNSSTKGPLAAGSYSFQAIYSGDANFAGSTSGCEPLTITAGTTATATVIKNAVGGTTVTGALPLGSSVFDTSTVTPTPATPTPTGSVAYTFFTSVDCTTGGTPAGGGVLVGGVPPNSSTKGPLAAGSYSFQAVFTSGDANFTGSTSGCEPLTISAGTTATATVIKNAAGGATVTGALPLGSSVFDTSTVTPTPATFTPAGSVAYTFFTSVDCTTGGTPAGGGVLVGGVPPNSNIEGPLGAGSYSFRAVFTSGDSNFGGSTSPCEPLTVNPGTSSTATVIKNAVGGATVSGALPLGSSVFDTSTVNPLPAGTGFTPTGSVNLHVLPQRRLHHRWHRRLRHGVLVGGVPPNSSTEGPLEAGSYGFEAVYSGDANFTGSTSACEPLTITAGTDGYGHGDQRRGGGTTVTGALPLGSSVFDTSTVTPTPGGFTPGGTVAYTFFTSIDCTTGGSPAAGRALVAGVPPNSATQGPLAAGSYSFRAVFTSGDSNFGGSTSTCEPLTINGRHQLDGHGDQRRGHSAAPVAGPLPLGSSVFDTATVTPTPATFTPAGSVAYTFFTSVDCTTGGTAAGGGALVAGVPPNSATQGPLAAGSYSFRAVFTSGNSNFGGSTSTCEPLTVNPGTSSTATVIKNAVGGTTVAGPLPLGSSVFDTATVTPTPAVFTPTGSVAYTFFTSVDCTTGGTPAGGGVLAGGVAPPSSTKGPLAAGSYSFRAIYSGDANFAGSTSGCEPLTIDRHVGHGHGDPKERGRRHHWLSRGRCRPGSVGV